jgi:predicted component of type VI protein secretion system
LHFASVDDFHPDGLLNQLSGYRSTKFNDQSIPYAGKQATASNGKGSEEAESQQETLSRLLGKRPLSSEQHQQTGSTLSDAKQSMISDVVRRLAENASIPDLSEAVAEASTVPPKAQDKTQLLRNLLHHKRFQKLESTWRSVDWLMHSIEPDPAIRCYILNIPRTELERERLNHQRPTSSSLYRLLRDALERDNLLESSFILIDNYVYSPNQKNMAMLGWLGSLVCCFSGTLFAEASSRFLEEDSEFSERLKDWQDFRKGESAKSVVLLYPKILLRLPYGPATDPILSQSFEELEEAWSPEALLWGNPAYALVVLTINQWALQDYTDRIPILADLPAYTFGRDGESHLQPCTKVILREQQIEQLLNLGLVPVIGNRNTNAIQLPWIQHLKIVNE